MAAFYVRSTTGSNANNGTTWALAKATLQGALSIAAAGDTIYVSQAHAETQASAMTNGCPGTNVSPCKIVCGNDGAQPPTALATTATITTTGANSITNNGSFSCYGIIFSSGTGGTRADMNLTNATGDIQYYEQCSFRLGTTVLAVIYTAAGGFGAGTSSMFWKNCTVKFGSTAQLFASEGPFTWSGGSVVSGSSTPAILFNTWVASAIGNGGPFLIENVDFSNFAATWILTLPNPVLFSPFIIRNCQSPAAWSGTLISGTYSHPGRVEMYNYDNAGTSYRLWIEDYMGTIRDETTVVRTGGATDGVTPLSWKISGGGRAVYPSQVLYSPEFVIECTTTGLSRTLTVQGIHDGVSNLTDHDVRLEVQYLSSASAPLGASATSQVADVLTAANNLTASTVAWTTSGLTNPNKWSLAATFTPQLKGFIHGRVAVMKASQTVYIDPPQANSLT